jgi:hypothetical protein
MIEERDELIERAVRALSPLPVVRGGAIARVLMAVRANQARPVPVWRRAARWVEHTSVSARAAGLLVAASLVIGFVARGTFGSEEIVPVADNASLALQPAANGAGEARAVPVAVGLQLANAKTVSVVGDFNGWDPSATPMERVGTSGFWSATLLAKPGRHTYAYLVDGTTLMADPRAPRAKSADYGGDASVLMVRTP